ncbi:hypothetical protein [Chelativorans sp. M5D2P16]|uniref:hypothetical protein n=1 Tax=Chelativorans sp. M5D2P16 TaxID=3095678 RepID=UPI002ACA699A|nr:hypothetical protein [Chelativorans sp. M5D2P16]MDZ5697639.1 hypothetical protein [Chelativorans sp. M5D2P16]
MTTPPGVFHIWSGTVGVTFQTRTIDFEIPEESLEGEEPVSITSFGMTVIFHRVSDDYAELAGPNGRRIQIDALLRAEQAWAAHRASDGGSG